MFDIGFGEMILLAAIALIAIGPKQLPEVARTVGKLLGELKKAMGEVTSTVANAREETDKAIRKVTSDLSDITEGINKDVAKHMEGVEQKLNVDAAISPNAVAPPAGDAGTGAVPKRVYPPNPIVDLPPHPGNWMDEAAIAAEAEAAAATTASQVTAQATANQIATPATAANLDATGSTVTSPSTVAPTANGTVKPSGGDST